MARLIQTFQQVQDILNAAQNGTLQQYYNKGDIDRMISGGFTYEVVNELPSASVSTMYKIYLLPASNQQYRNIYKEYLTIEEDNQGSKSYSWEVIGSTEIDIDQYKKIEQEVTLETYNPQVTYEPGDSVLYNGNIYTCLSETTGNWNSNAWQNELTDNTVYRVSTDSNLTIPSVPVNNKLGISIYITASTNNITLTFPPNVSWFIDTPDSSTINSGSTKVLFMLDGKCSLIETT